MSPQVASDTVVDGRYRVVNRIGSGGMADVWCAEDLQLGRKVALKLLHERFEAERLAQVMKGSTAREVGDMMASVVREGTGTAAALSGFPVAGKTGTAEIVPAQGINQPWFIGFAPRDNPRIAIAATVERCSACQGGTTAAPIAKAVLQELLR